ncbi:MAG: site-specific integrase, partial [Ignavibacteria bacterium]|nr:site-specific integrase [Ignavibacteria bacterium]
EQFFTQYLIRAKGVSENTIASYQDTFKIFLPFAAKYLSKKLSDIVVSDITCETVPAFLEYVEKDRQCTVRTRNLRLAALKSFAKMLRICHPECMRTAEMIKNIPSMREQRSLIGFLYSDEILKVLEGVDLKTVDGFRDYTILHLLADTGARASEIANLKVDCFHADQMTFGILGKGNRYRLVQIWPKTAGIVKTYIDTYRRTPKPAWQKALFVNQRGESLTRHGIYRICEKHLKNTLTAKRLQQIHPVHSFRHSCAIQMMMSGAPVTDIKNHLGHEHIQSTMIYLKLDLSRRKEVQKKFIAYTQSVFKNDPKFDDLTDWQQEKSVLEWLDKL